MYKIYVNGTPVFLLPTSELPVAGLPEGPEVYSTPYLGKKKQLLQYLDLLDKNQSVTAVVLHHPSLDTLWADFQSCFKILEAAGGYVLNSRGELLVFFRRGSWDLPKGKIDPGETPEQAAVREVQEETGVQHLELGVFLQHTWHTYPLKGKRILKKTWWYHMRTPDLDLVPQTEEDIEQIEWVDPAAWMATGPAVYGSIADVVRVGMALEG